MTDIEKLNLILKELEIKSPLKVFINPQIEFIETKNFDIKLNIIFSTIDCNTGNQISLTMSWPIDKTIKNRILFETNGLAEVIRAGLIELLTHEIDESILINNKK